MMIVEFERSYIFPHEDILHILNFLGAQIDKFALILQDDYLNPNLRIRQITFKNDNDICGPRTLTRKSGNKNSRQRTEENRNIDPETVAILTADSKLQIIKTRYRIKTVTPGVIVTLDIIETPMKIAVLEIESTNDQMPPTAKELFGVQLQECPLSAWNFFRQKIGICGAPSSGKTETAKALSHLLNTQFQANSFHVTEYATSFIQKYNRHPNIMDQFMIWYSQRAREENATSKANIVISDSPTFLAYIYMIYHNKKQMDTQFRIHLTKLYKRILEDINSYNHIIYLQPKGVTQNNIRFQDVKEIPDIAKRIYTFLQEHNIPHIIAEREDVQRILNNIFYINEIGKE